MNGLAEYRSVDEMRARYAAVKAKASRGLLADAVPPVVKEFKTFTIPAPQELLWTHGSIKVPWPGVESATGSEVFKNGKGWIKPTTAQRIVIAICKVHGIRRADLIGPRRYRTFAYPRMFAAALMRERCPHLSYPMIGKLLGGRDHSTILHACREWPKHAARFAKQIAEVEAML